MIGESEPARTFAWTQDGTVGNVASSMNKWSIRLVFLLVGISFGATCERCAHACAPTWSVSGLVGDAVDKFCLDTGTSRQ